MPSKDQKVEAHPSYGMIGISHTSSNGTRLFGSEFNHNHFVQLTIKRCERHRDLSQDWYFGREELISVFLSEAQYIEMMARPNIGDGVPCTLEHVMRERMPPPPPAEPIKDRFNADMEADAKRCTEDIRSAIVELNEAIESGKIGKTQLREISTKLKYAARAVDEGIPFVRKSFQEEMEKVVHHAAAEIEATVVNTAIRLGIEKMREISETGPKLIEGKE
jgi:hypothetical protein